MTTYVPLDPDAEFPTSPSFLLPSTDPDWQLRQVIQRILKARRIVVICGAGISVASGIPDFRSSEGLFKSLSKKSKGGTTTGGRDLFDASVFSSESTTAMFCQMIARLAELSATAFPSPFHQVLKSLDDRTRLLRVYTQNIDMLELKSGLSFGVPELSRKPQARCKQKSNNASNQDAQKDLTSIKSSTPPTVIPRCIPLHGTLDLLRCTNTACKSTFSLEAHHESFSRGELPPCTVCLDTESTRELVGKRPRGVGKLRPEVVLYNEDHKLAEEIGEAARRDLVGSSQGSSRSGPDLLLVVGTSLKVPGTKRIVREFSKSVRHNRASKQAAQLQTPLPSPRRTPAGEDSPINSVYVNLDFPVPTREWRDVFDVWIQGDAQRFASLLNDELTKETLKDQTSPTRQQSGTNTPSHGRHSGQPISTDGPKRRQAHTPETPSSHTKRRKISCNAIDTSIPIEPLPKLYIRIPARPHLRFGSPSSVDQKHCGEARTLSIPTPPPSPSPSSPFREPHLPEPKRRLAGLLLADEVACTSAFQRMSRDMQP